MKSKSPSELAGVEGHVIAGEEHIARQREIVRRLERAGRGNSETAKVALDLLHSMELAQREHSIAISCERSLKLMRTRTLRRGVPSGSPRPQGISLSTDDGLTVGGVQCR